MREDAVNDPTRQGDFEVYPYADAEEPLPQSPATPPRPLVSLPAAAPGPVVAGRAGVGRRGLIFWVVGVGLAGFGGLSVLSAAPSGVESQAGEWTAGPVPVDEPADGVVPVLLQTTEGDIGVEVPGTWQVLREGDLIHLSRLDGSELLARLPDRPTPTGETQLRLEAEYTRARFRAEFVPDGEPAVEWVNEPPFEVSILRSTGDVAGSPGREDVHYLVDTDRERGLVVAVLLPDAAEPGAAAEAQRLVEQLLEGFRAL